MRVCSICGKGYKTRVPHEDILIWGCGSCGKANAAHNEKELEAVEIKRGDDTLKEFYPYGRPKRDAKFDLDAMKIVSEAVLRH